MVSNGQNQVLVCDKCSYTWSYSGSAERATCPSCSSKVRVEEQSVESARDLFMHVNDVVQNVKNEAGVRIRELEADVEELRDENERLRVQIAELKDKVDDLGES